jgi:F0F1-type ATP synthase delta subunit
MASSTRIANRYASALMNQAKADGTLETVSKDFQVIMNAGSTEQSCHQTHC